MLKRVFIALLTFTALTGASGYGLHLYYKGQIFNPSAMVPDPGKAPFPLDVVTIQTPDGLALNSWWHAPEPGEATVLYLHGNYQSIGHYARAAAPLVDAGFGVLMLDYRGYGGNPGDLSDEGFLIDGLAGLDWLESQGIASKDVLVYGYSLGTGVAVPLAAKRDIRALALAAPFASIAHMGYRQFPRWFVDAILADRFDSIDHIDEITAPVLIIHGSKDTTIPVEQSQKLANAGGDTITRIVFDGASHGWDLFEPRGNTAIINFFKAQSGERPPQNQTTVTAK